MFSKDIAKPLLSFALLAFVLVGGLAACSGYHPKRDSYVSREGTETVVESNKESCVKACNADFDRCGETSAAQTPVGRGGQMTGILGAQADCRDSLRRCLSRCKER